MVAAEIAEEIAVGTPLDVEPFATPFYADQVLYQALVLGNEAVPRLAAWRFNGWEAETLSWKKGCYIHAGLSNTGPVSIKGPDAARYLQSLVINSFAKFAVGTMKHAVACRNDGMIAAHGIVERKAADEFESYASFLGLPTGPVPFDVRIAVLSQYLFQIAGPTSLQVLEKVTGASLRDIRFLTFRETRIGGIRTEIARIGMSGNLAFELHGPIEDGPRIYEAVYRAGREFGIERLGWGSYLVNHVEGGFPQATWTFVPAPTGGDGPDPLLQKHRFSGSVDPSDLRARMRTPVEVRWHTMVRFDHDFVGREALQREIASPKRTTVTLRWNADDVLDIYASLLRQGPAYKPIELPYAPHTWPQAHADHVLAGGRHVGVSSGTIYSHYFREVLSMGCLDLAHANLGTEVIVQWGDHGGRIKDVRATVAPFPYLTEGRNSDVDLATYGNPARVSRSR
jgi:vanillate/3-O-methylgallate O-demethylase